MCRDVSSTLVARRFHELANDDEKRSLTPLKLMKLVYIAHGWHLGIYKTPLIGEEVYAWQYGPVFPDLYDEIKKFGSDPVMKVGRNILELQAGIEELNPQEIEIVGAVWKGYKHLSAFQLCSLTHMEGTPWSKTRSEHGEERNVVIERNMIRDYYEGLRNEK